MKYNLHYTDRRHRYNQWFFCYITFSKYMNEDAGPLNFCTAMDWFTEKFGKSCEVRQWEEMNRWGSIPHNMALMSLSTPSMTHLTDATASKMKEFTNHHWSWSNGTDNLRIYIRSKEELSFFRLAFSGEKNKS